MLQYVIIAEDGKDEGAMDRRMELRPVHFAGVRTLKENNNFVFGGAILDEAESMRGSVMVVQFNTEEEFKQWFATEPYITGGVWKVIEVKRFRVAVV